MRQYRQEIGMIAGIRYKLIFDRRGNQQVCDTKYAKEWRWFLWLDKEYVGDFKTKKVAMVLHERKQDNGYKIQNEDYKEHLATRD